MTIESFLRHLPDSSQLAKTASGWSCRCPAHQDNRASLSIGLGDKGKILVHCFTGCTTQSICQAIGLTIKDLMPEKEQAHAGKGAKTTLVATYNYTDESGALLYQKLRYQPKTFRIRRPDPAHADQWLWGLNCTRKVIYHLPEVIKAVKDERPVMVVEGEKDVEVLHKNGFAATCNPMGAAEDWLPEYCAPFQNAEAIVIADKDDAGRVHARAVKTALEPVSRCVRYIELPDIDGRKVKDASDWFEAGGTAAEFDEIVQVPETIDLTEELWDITELLPFDVANDPNAVIGFRDGKTTRYLCKGYGAWIIGQSGIGKSTLSQQQGFMFALNRPFFGITPVKACRILIVQSENDQGDCAEATQGIIEGGSFTPKEIELLSKRVKIIRCRGRTGAKFCDWLHASIDKHESDIVYVDPLIRYAGIDVSRQDQVTKFLNDCLDPVLAKSGVILIGSHHTGKPKAAKDTRGWSIYDHAYAGIGSSELVNWARAISIVQTISEGLFEMLLAKRGTRAWATHPNSNEKTLSIFLKHSFDKIFWEQTDPPAHQPKAPKSAGRPNKVTEIACSNLHSFCAACKPDGEGKNEIARRLEAWLASQRKDASISTCKLVVEALVANAKLTKNDQSLYLKGPQA